MRSLVTALGLATLVPMLAVTPGPTSAVAVASADRSATSAAASTTARATPRLRIRTLARRLDHPWDVKPLPGGALVFTQRDKRSLSVLQKGKVRRIAYPKSSVWVAGETGLMGLAVDPDFASNRRIYTCQGGFTASGGHDVRVLAFTLNARLRKAKNAGELLTGLPASSGRHGGCRLAVTSDGSLLVGTGDAAVGTNPRDLDSLGGKTLRLDRFTGAPWPQNPYAAQTGARRYVHTLGHRNVQGVAERADGTLWSIEQGSSRDDEANLLVSGGDYGWNPVPGYDESVPMTDQGLPGDQVEAAWSSGPSTLATSGGTFVSGARWGSLDDTLAVACLKASRVLFLGLDPAGTLTRVRAPRALRTYGRIRTVANAGNGDLLLTTDNGGRQDVILRVSPR